MSFFKDFSFNLFENVLATEATQQSSPSNNKSIFESLKTAIPMIIIMVVFYFFLILPQNRRKKRQEEMISSVKKGEEILTSSGIFGKIVNIDEKSDSILVEISKGVEVKILKNQIVNIPSRNTSLNTQKKTQTTS